jgi:spore germination protein GerM
MAKRQPRKRASAPNRNGINAVAVVCIAAIVMLTGYFIFRAIRQSPDEPPSSERTELVLHYVNPAAYELETEMRFIVTGGRAQMLDAAMREWLLGPENSALIHNISPDTAVNIVYMTEGTARVTFSDSFYELSPMEVTFNNMSLVWSLTSLPFIENIEIYVSEASVGVFNRLNIGLDVTEPVENITLLLYFGDNMGRFLVPEEREIERDPSRSLEEQVILELLRGSSFNNSRTIPVDVALLSIRTQDSTCYINFSPAFRADGGSLAETFMLYSIVNSLTELDYIVEVQFLVNNDFITDEMGFNHSLGSPIQRDTSLIGK